MIPFVLGADDYGIAPATNAAIRALLGQGPLSATSAMVLFPDWPTEGALLRRLDADVSIGLHLTLTDHPPLVPSAALAPHGTLPPWPTLARMAHTGRLDREAARAEWDAQLRRFQQIIGRPPDYLDGHHHVHQLPVLRDLAVALARRHQIGIRTCHESLRNLVRRPHRGRAAALSWAARGLRRRAHQASVPTNSGFTGVYDFTLNPDGQPWSPSMAEGIAPGTFWMTHPGAVDDVLRGRDGLLEPREAEARTLASPLFRQWLDQRGLSPRSWKDAVAPSPR